MTIEKNPKIIHRIYFENFKPFRDPYLHFLDSWHKEMPDYKIMLWGKDNLNVEESAWTRRANEDKDPVFLAEYFRWKVLSEFGGIYLDADCEIVNGKVLSGLLDELYSQDDFDVFFGVEERANGHPTAQTIAAKKSADLVTYMRSLYQDSLAPLWRWRGQRGLIGPQLMSLYFWDKGINVPDNGFFKNIDEPVIAARAKVYPQYYFSPKFAILGDNIDYQEDKTCVYHMFANANVDFSSNKRLDQVRKDALTFDEYRKSLEQALTFPRHYHASHFQIREGAHTDRGITASASDGLVFYGPYFSLPNGQYLARLNLLASPTQGSVKIAVTADSGNEELAVRRLKFDSKLVSAIDISFEIDAATRAGIEVTLSVEGIDRLEFESLNIEKKSGDALPIALSATSKEKKPSLRKLHRIYFGFDGKPDQFPHYLETWKEQLPDFEIIHWNSSNLPMDINPYVRQLYKEHDHAFLTDYFRWYVLKEFGGTYLDADVEIVNGNIYRTLIEELETTSEIEAFIGIDEKSGGWYTAHSMASKPQSEIARFMCNLYENFGSFTAWRKKGFYFWAPQLTALYFANRGHNKDGMGTSPHLDHPIVVAGVKIYPQEWFAPLAPTGDAKKPFKLNAMTENSCLAHHFACSWHDEDSMYLAHSRKHGGQANVMLRDLLASQSNQSFLASGDRIQTVAGAKRADGIATRGVDGHFCFGPYTQVDRGNYELIFEIDDVVRLGTVVAEVAADSGNVIIERRTISDASIDGKKIIIDFSADKRHDDVEFRLSVGKDSEFLLKEIKIRRLDEPISNKSSASKFFKSLLGL
jgi:mannosyltransferase OCH1-like enzyme